ncbi:VMO1 protein, partial [Fregata magnificens]|nr:VMO1 protein [Fregata magnificens]
SVVAMSSGGPWGDWAWTEMCPKGSCASSVTFKVEVPQGVTEDDTALSRIWLHCSHGRNPSGGYTAESQRGRWGHWLEACWCPHRGHLVGFTLRVKVPQCGLLSDEVAATSTRFACSDGHVLEGPGSAWGQWGGWSPQCPRAVCRHPDRAGTCKGAVQGGMALNDLHLFCC